MAKMLPLRKKVALLIETSNSYGRGLLSGVISYHQRHSKWTLFIPENERGAPPPSWLSQWKPDGIIARIENAEIAEVIQRLNVPAVDLSAARMLPGIPWVETDDQSVAQSAFEHLAERGFNHFGYCGDPGFNWSVWRNEQFTKIVTENGYPCHVYNSLSVNDPEYSWATEFERLCEWIDELPKPVGILSCYDIRGRQVLDACNHLGYAVPEQISVIGVDNDSLTCDACMPPLTSIALNSHDAGFKAAELLDEAMHGVPPSPEAHLIAPLGIEERQSTDSAAVDDPVVTTALKYIRENACFNIRVSDVLKQVPISRRILESRFQKLIGRTPHQEIQRRRIDRVKQLLQTTDLPLDEIARITGYEHSEYLSVVFRRETGETARQFRERTATLVLQD